MPAIVRRTDRQRRTYRACSSGGGHDERPGNGRGRNKLQREDVRRTRHIRLVRRKVLADGLADETPAGCPAGVPLSTSRVERQTITSLEAPYVHSAHAGRRTVGMYFYLRRLGAHDSVVSSKPRNRGRVLQPQARDLDRIEDAHFQRTAVLARNCSRTNQSAVAVELGAVERGARCHGLKRARPRRNPVRC